MFDRVLNITREIFDSFMQFMKSNKANAKVNAVYAFKHKIFNPTSLLSMGRQWVLTKGMIIEKMYKSFPMSKLSSNVERSKQINYHRLEMVEHWERIKKCQRFQYSFNVMSLYNLLIDQRKNYIHHQYQIHYGKFVWSQFVANFTPVTMLTIPKICSSLKSFNPNLLTLTNGKLYHIAQWFLHWRKVKHWTISFSRSPS